MAIRVGINGFGRIGRQVVRASKLQGTKDLDFVLAHVSDLNEVYRFERNQVIRHVEELLLA